MGTIDYEREDRLVDMSPMKEESKLRSQTPMIDQKHHKAVSEMDVTDL